MGLLSYFGLTKNESLSPAPTDDFWYTVDPHTGFAYQNSSNASGVHVNEAVAMTYSVCWAATRVLCGTAGMLPFNLHRSRPTGGSDVMYDHPLHRIIHDAPNDEMSSMTFRTSRMNHQVNRGNCFAEILRDRGGRVRGLYPIHASRIPVATNIKRVNGRLLYIINNDDGTKSEIRQENMFHVPSIISEDGVIGRGVVENARLTIGFGLAAEKHGAAYFGNGARPGLIIKGAKFKKGEDAEDFRRQWVDTHGGPHQHGKPAILPPDSDVTVLPFNAQDSQFLELREHTAEDICRWYGIPNHFVNDLRHATFSNIEHIGIEFVKYSLMPWLKLWEQEAWRKLLTEEEQKTHYAKFNVAALERGDIQSRTTANQAQLFNGLLDLDTWAEREDMNPLGGELGKKRWMQTAMSTIDTIANGPPAAEPSADQGASESDELKSRMETYGIGVRAGSITPQLDDEEQYREALGLPPMTEEAKVAWKEDKGIRRPITLQPSGDKPAATPFGQPKQPDEPESTPDEPKDDPKDDGLSALREQLEATKNTQRQLAAAMLRDVMGRMLSGEIKNVKDIAQNPSRFDVRLKEFYDKHVILMTRTLTEPVSVVLAASGDVRTPADVVSTLTQSHVSESIRQLESLTSCTADELPGAVEQCVSTWHEERVVVTV